MHMPCTCKMHDARFAIVQMLQWLDLNLEVRFGFHFFDVLMFGIQYGI